MVMKGSQIIDIGLDKNEAKGSAGFLTPIVGLENGLELDYDRNNERIFWVEAMAKDSENVSVSLISNHILVHSINQQKIVIYCNFIFNVFFLF